MEITVEAVSPFGIKHSGQEKWTNVSKGLDLGDLKTKFHAGDVVALTLNSGGYITAIELVKQGAPKPAWKGGKSFGGGAKSSEFRSTEQIIRSVAVEAVFQSPLLAVLAKDMSQEEAYSEAFKLSDSVAEYITKGV